MNWVNNERILKEFTAKEDESIFCNEFYDIQKRSGVCYKRLSDSPKIISEVIGGYDEQEKGIALRFCAYLIAQVQIMIIGNKRYSGYHIDELKMICLRCLCSVYEIIKVVLECNSKIEEIDTPPSITSLLLIKDFDSISDELIIKLLSGEIHTELLCAVRILYRYVNNIKKKFDLASLGTIFTDGLLLPLSICEIPG